MLVECFAGAVFAKRRLFVMERDNDFKYKIIQSRNNVLLDWQYFVKYSSHSIWMWEIFCIIL